MFIFYFLHDLSIADLPCVCCLATLNSPVESIGNSWPPAAFKWLQCFTALRLKIALTVFLYALLSTTCVHLHTSRCTVLRSFSGVVVSVYPESGRLRFDSLPGHT